VRLVAYLKGIALTSLSLCCMILPSGCGLFTNQHVVIRQKTWIYDSAGVKNWNPAMKHPYLYESGRSNMRIFGMKQINIKRKDSVLSITWAYGNGLFFCGATQGRSFGWMWGELCGRSRRHSLMNVLNQSKICVRSPLWVIRNCLIT